MESQRFWNNLNERFILTCLEFPLLLFNQIITDDVIITSWWRHYFMLSHWLCYHVTCIWPDQVQLLIACPSKSPSATERKICCLGVLGGSQISKTKIETTKLEAIRAEENGPVDPHELTKLISQFHNTVQWTPDLRTDITRSRTFINLTTEFNVPSWAHTELYNAWIIRWWYQCAGMSWGGLKFKTVQYLM